MQKVIKFNLSGFNAVFRKPESNEVYFTYNNVHKIMLLGILGSIIGENGYNYNQLQIELNPDNKSLTKKLPEFYESLRDMKISIVPKASYGNFSKKIQQFNNSVGYASKEKGNNLIITEQYLENPNWDIYVLLNDSKVSKKMEEYLMNRKCEYIPYLGKNEHFAKIDHVEISQAKKQEEKVSCHMESIFTDNSYEYEDDFWDDVEMFSGKKNKFEYQEKMPTGLDIEIGYTDFKNFVFTNQKLELLEPHNIYQIDKKYFYFF